MVMVGNLIKCKKCGKELQPEDIAVGGKEEDFISICAFCGGKISRI